MRRWLPLGVAAVALGGAVQLAVDGAVGRFAYASPQAYQALLSAREGAPASVGWLWPLLLAPAPMEWLPGVLGILAMLGAVALLTHRASLPLALLLLAASGLPLTPLLGDQTALACLVALWLAGRGGPLAGFVAAAVRWDLALLVRSRASLGGAVLGLAVSAAWLLDSGLPPVPPLEARWTPTALVALTAVPALRAGRAAPLQAAGAVLAALLGGLSPAPLVLGLLGPEDRQDTPVHWLPAAGLGLWLALAIPGRASDHELVAGHLVRLAQQGPLSSPAPLVQFRVPEVERGSDLPVEGLLALPPTLPVPSGALPVGAWSLDDQVVMRFYASEEGLSAAREQLSAFDLDLRVVVPGELTAAGPSDGLALDRCGPKPVFALSGGTLLGATGRLQDPMLVNIQSRVQVEVALPVGTYELALRASTTRLDGQAGRIEVHLGGSKLGALLVPEGPATEQRLRFDVTEPTRAPLWLQFTNDVYREGQDRNVVLSTLTLDRLASESPERRAARLRAALAGSDLMLVSIDTLRADHVGVYGYHRDTTPRIDALAGVGVVARNAVAASHWTAPSHTSLLTGLHPQEHGVVDFPEPEALGPVPTLASVLADAGYRTTAVTGGGYVAQSTGLDRGFQQMFEVTDTPDVAFAQAAALWEEPTDQPRFLFLHTYQVHDPYDPPAPFDRWFAPDLPEDPRLRGDLRDTYLFGWRPTPAELGGMKALYDGEIRYTDDRLALVLDALERSGRREHTLVVVTSDHGEEFFEHGGMSHARLQGEVVRVPLVLSHPAMPALVDPVVDAVFPGVDVMPTVLDLLGVEAPELSGRSRVADLAGDCGAPTAFSASEMIRDHRFSALDADWHYIEDGDARLLYDLRADVTERSDVAGEHPEVLADRAREVDAWRSTLSQKAPTRAVERTEDEREQLRALGYLQ